MVNRYKIEMNQIGSYFLTDYGHVLAEYWDYQDALNRLNWLIANQTVTNWKLLHIYEERSIRAGLRRELHMRKKDHSLSKHTLAWIRLLHSQSIKREREEVLR